MTEKRSQPRCVKNVGMLCTLLNGNVTRSAIVRNFSGSGLFFEAAVQMMPGAYVVLRVAHSADAGDGAGDSAVPSNAVAANDPEVCAFFRSHTVAQVRRCERLVARDDSPRYGIAAEIQMWTD